MVDVFELLTIHQLLKSISNWIIHSIQIRWVRCPVCRFKNNQEHLSARWLTVDSHDSKSRWPVLSRSHTWSQTWSLTFFLLITWSQVMELGPIRWGIWAPVKAVITIAIRLRYDYDTTIRYDTTTHSTTSEVVEITICMQFDCETTTTRLRRKTDMLIFCSRRMEAGARYTS